MNPNGLDTRCIEPGHPEWPTDALDLLPAWSHPAQLWLAGPLSLHDVIAAHPVALTGTRAPSAYGDTVAADLATTLTRQQVPVIASASFGIPRAALQAALDAGGAPVAVRAGSLDHPFAATQRELLRTVAATGLLITSSPRGTAPSRAELLAHHRLLAALAAVTVVVESGIRSGALTTAAWARAAGRPVGAVPGPVTSTTSAGCHRLLGEGATVIADAADILALRRRELPTTAPV